MLRQPMKSLLCSILFLFIFCSDYSSVCYAAPTPIKHNLYSNSIKQYDVFNSNPGDDALFITAIKQAITSNKKPIILLRSSWMFKTKMA